MSLNIKTTGFFTNESVGKELKIPGPKSWTIFKKEERHAAHNYVTVPVALVKGKGVFVWDVDGKRYYDCSSANFAVNQGHCHPKIVNSLQKQAEVLTLISRAFFSDALGEYAEYITKVFGYDRVLPINSGSEAVEAACKLARRWGYQKKNVAPDEAKLLFASGNFWGSTIAGISTTTDNIHRKNYGPLMSGCLFVPYNDLNELENALKKNPNIAGFVVEPLQTNAGVIVPHPGYLRGVRELCTKYNVLWVDDETQVGLGRTGKLLAVHEENVKPDIVCLGESLSGGTVAVSAVLADDDVMLCVRPGEHGSTFGGNQLACKVAITALEVIIEENLSENAKYLGNILKKELQKLPKDLVKEIRGKGLLYGVVINQSKGFTAMDLCIRLRNNGLLAKPIRNDVVQIAPPLVMTESQLKECCTILLNTINSFRK